MKGIEKIFEFRKNIIYDDGDWYILEHIDKHERCWFDHSDCALKAVKRAIKKDASAQVNDRGAFEFRPKGRYGYYVSQLLYGAYHNRPLSWVRKGRVGFIDGNNQNLTYSNLYHSRADEPDNKNRRIWRLGNHIFLWAKKSNRVYFTGWNSDLYDLLCDHRIFWDYHPQHEVLNARMVRKGIPIKDLNFTLHALIYGFHYYGVRRSNLIGGMRKMLKELRKNDTTIDHFDNNQENVEIWNLSLMERKENNMKCAIVGGVRLPFFLFGVALNGQYRIVSGKMCLINWPPSDGGLPLGFPTRFDFVLCKNAEALIAYLKEFMRTPSEDGLTPKQNLKDNPDSPCLSKYFGDFGADAIRQLLLVRDEDDFEIYEAKQEEVKT